MRLTEWEAWSMWLDREHKRCHQPSKICREVGDYLLDQMLKEGL